MVGYMLVPFIQMLRDRGVNTLQQVNPALAKTSSLGKAKRMPKHLMSWPKTRRACGTCTSSSPWPT